MHNFIYKVNSNWKFSHNISNNKKSHILILWDSHYWSNIILHSDDQFISCLLHNVNGTSIVCTTFYAFNEEIKRLDLWEYTKCQFKVFNLPWVIMGDFNAILSPYDRMTNGLHSSSEEQNFIYCVSYSKLIEPKFSGNFYTWRGGQNLQFIVKLIAF